MIPTLSPSRQHWACILVFIPILIPIFHPGAAITSPPTCINVTIAFPAMEPLTPNDRNAARANTKRIYAIIDHIDRSGGRGHLFPGGIVLLRWRRHPHPWFRRVHPARPVFYDDSADVTCLIQVNALKDFGFEANPARKHVPTVTVRLRHNACRLRDMTIMVDPKLPPDRLLPSAAVQLAHIKYLPDNNIGIMETTGQGSDFLLDNVIVERVYIGQDHKGGMVKVRDIERLDAKYDIRLDNGNHCGQGDYSFEHLYMVGRPPLTNGGVFFDWIDG